MEIRTLIETKREVLRFKRKEKGVEKYGKK